MYEVIFTNKAERQLKELEAEMQKRIIAALERARVRPEAHFKKLVGEKAYSLRVGHYRVIADVAKKKLVILVLKVGHRRKVYKK